MKENKNENEAMNKNFKSIMKSILMNINKIPERRLIFDMIDFIQTNGDHTFIIQFEKLIHKLTDIKYSNMVIDQLRNSLVVLRKSTPLMWKKFSPN